jgi:hypothetical protein
MAKSPVSNTGPKGVRVRLPPGVLPNKEQRMPRETKLPNLGEAPSGYSWRISRIQNKVNGKFGTQGFTYFVTVMKGDNQIIDTRFFISKNDQDKTQQKVNEVAAKIRKIINP